MSTEALELLRGLSSEDAGERRAILSAIEERGTVTPDVLGKVEDLAAHDPDPGVRFVARRIVARYLRHDPSPEDSFVATRPDIPAARPSELSEEERALRDSSPTVAIASKTALAIPERQRSDTLPPGEPGPSRSWPRPSARQVRGALLVLFLGAVVLAGVRYGSEVASGLWARAYDTYETVKEQLLASPGKPAEKPPEEPPEVAVPGPEPARAAPEEGPPSPVVAETAGHPPGQQPPPRTGGAPVPPALERHFEVQAESVARFLDY